MPVELIAGLGNPGPEYSETRHNAGFWFLDTLAREANCAFSHESRFSGEVAVMHSQGRKVRLIKPTTFMNRSGQAVSALSRYFKIPPENILIVHDELDLAPGDIRLKFGGGHGGHNGLRDLLAHLGTRDFWRLRVGIGHPGSAKQVVNYVLKPPSLDDRCAIDRSLELALSELANIVAGEGQKAMNRLHTRRPEGPGAAANNKE